MNYVVKNYQSWAIVEMISIKMRRVEMMKHDAHVSAWWLLSQEITKREKLEFLIG